MPWIYNTPLGPSAPISDGELKRLVADGTIGPSTPIKRAGSDAGFVDASNIKGLEFPEPEFATPLEPDDFDFTPPSKPRVEVPPAPVAAIPMPARRIEMKPTLGKYITPSILESLWILSYIAYLLGIGVVGLIAINARDGAGLFVSYIIAGIVQLIVIRISLECVAVLFDIANYLKHIASK